MIKIESIVKVVDNSGALQIKCLCILGKSYKSVGTIGDHIIALIKRIKLKKRKKLKRKRKLRRQEILLGLIVNVKYPIKRNGGNIFITFNSSCVILLNINKNPIGSRILNPIFKELSFVGYLRLLSLSKFII